MRVVSSFCIGLLLSTVPLWGCKEQVATERTPAKVSRAVEESTKATFARVGLPIIPSDVSEIKSSQNRIPKKEELIAALKKEPTHLYGKEVPLTMEEFNALPEKVRQIVALLVNRGILHWKEDNLYDYNDRPTSRAMLDDYINRLDLFLAAYLPEGSETELAERSASSTGTSTSTATSGSSGSGFTPMTTLSIAVGLITAVGTLIWGYREFVAGSAAIKKDEEKAKKIAQNLEVRKNLDARNRTMNRPIPNANDVETPAKTNADPNAKGKAEEPGGKFYDPGSSKFGKYVFSTLLVATGLAVLGLSVYQIVDAAKK